ncbi:hypothetical protein QBC33DRAFT_4981 [Phialemonium atrogriseum]|uniref:MINDY deubiquitinase domain-containing protein n=1 Tax=Phialemonium atrogriseum TaxID=1093897 RepID=A0AAJ0C8W2_9PEZI|nr:uncharacterized protein QBC33DRAFT_4981 [Phialemonium atrogriseum]KAK1772310.1 hypothetical protein QBC33DRAFT_4981 [Phialemonium atrogriseum]
MVTRKPLPDDAAVDPAVGPQLRMQDMRQELWSATESEASGDQIWGDETPRNKEQSQRGATTAEDIPNSLRPGLPANYSNFSNLDTEPNVWGEPSNPTTASEHSKHGKTDSNAVPAILRPGGGVAPLSETNPFKRKLPDGATQESSNLPPTLPNSAPPAGPAAALAPPTLPFSELSLNETSTNNPWQPALDEKRLDSAPPAMPTAPEPELPEYTWDLGEPSRQPSTGPPPASPALISLPSDADSAAWDEERPKPEPSPLSLPHHDEGLGDSHAWDDLGSLDKPKTGAKAPSVLGGGSTGLIDDWNLIDVDAPPPAHPPKQSIPERPEGVEDGTSTATLPAQQETPEQPPSVPPGPSAEQPPAPPPRPAPAGMTETYQIKKITWYDVNAANNPRNSPILVQNANGPCPLVALVNALTLTTPAGTNTALVETLRSREQVSLGLLLDAVFDELMSPRRNNPEVSLPDVTELYAFLQGLHTGMNVNPRFIPTPEVIKAFKRTSLTHLHPTERGDMIPGSFEDTKEMRLYSTFSVPLIHGWLPPKADAEYGALERRAVSYEDAQNLLFREEELEEKLSNNSHEGLTEEEQEIYQDIFTIKSFLDMFATQLTPWGLDVIRKAMNPGSVAILFRNDHFSTLYRHPQTLELLTLVTDAGYAEHPEIVWESLVDVNGEHAEFFSGDFRLVGGAGHHQQERPASGNFATSNARNDGWTAVQGRQGRDQQQSTGGNDEPPVSPKHEQEDRDLALALQLQEEEDERHRSEQARRQRESRLSEQFIEQQGQQPAAGSGNRRGGSQGASARGALAAPSAPNRRSSSSVGGPVSPVTSNGAQLRGGAASRGRGGVAAPQQNVRSLIPPPRGAQAVRRPADEGLDDAPPSYEQAAKQTPYVPPAGHPAHPGSTGQGSGSGTRVSPSPLVGRAGRSPGPGGVPGRYRQGVPVSSAAGAGSSSGRDRDCVVM